MSTTPANVPDKPALEGLETLWDTKWEESGLYRFRKDGQTRACRRRNAGPVPVSTAAAVE